MNFLKNIFSKKSIDLATKQKAVVYLYCLFVSIVFWFLVVFAKEYNTVVYYPVTYTNIPQNKVITGQLPDSIAVDIKASGFNIIGFKLFTPKHNLVIDVKHIKLSENQTEFLFDMQQSIDLIAKQIKYNVKVNRIYPEYIKFNFHSKSYKTVPIKLNALFSYAKQYQSIGHVEMNPSKIIISGDYEQLDKIHFIETENLIAKNIDKPLSKKLALIVPEKAKEINLLNKFVQINLSVEKFTEVKVEVPVSVINLPNKLAIKTFPEKVTVTCLVPLSKYNTINANSFTITADYSKLITEKNNKLKLSITNTPSFAKSLKLQTDKVEFILKKK